MKRVLATVTAVLAILGIAASVEHFVNTDHHNPGFTRHPVLMGFHVILGAAYLGIALLQFSGPIRSRWPRLHRVLGRVGVTSGLVAGGTALWISALFPISGPTETVLIFPFAALFVGALLRGLWLVRAGRIAEHREWMIRAMAVGTGIATMRLIFVPSLILLGAGEELARWLSLASFVAAFVLHSSLAELWIRATRTRPAEAGRPELQGA